MRVLLNIMISVIICQTLALGQNQERKAQIDQFDQYLELNVAPLTIFSYRPRYRMGVEYYIDNWSFSINGAYGSYCLNQYILGNGKWGEAYEYYALRPQFMFCYKSYNDIEHHFGIEVFYINNSDRLANDYFTKLESPELKYIYEKADYQRTMKGFHFVFETKRKIDYHLGFEFYLGLGVAYRTNRYSNIEGLQVPENYIFEESLFFKNYKEEGAGWLASGTIGIKLTYLLWKN